MNIFYLDHNPTLCAEFHFNSHINSGIQEMTCVLCTAIFKKDPHYYVNHLMHQGFPKPATRYANNRFVRWVEFSTQNFVDALEIAMALCREKRVRWPENLSHKYQAVLDYIARNGMSNLFPSRASTAPAIAMEFDTFRGCYEYGILSSKQWSHVNMEWTYSGGFDNLVENSIISRDDVMEMYRYMYNTEKKHLEKYSNRKNPYWLWP